MVAWSSLQNQKCLSRDAWVAQSLKCCPRLSLDPKVLGSRSTSGSMLSGTSDSPSPPHVYSLFLSLSFSQAHLKKKKPFSSNPEHMRTHLGRGPGPAASEDSSILGTWELTHTRSFRAASWRGGVSRFPVSNKAPRCSPKPRTLSHSSPPRTCGLHQAHLPPD